MSRTSIEWTDRTWNPTRGCSRVSEGCRNCYAEAIAARFARPPDRPTEGGDPGGLFYGFAVNTLSGPRWTGRVELIPDKLDEPLHWRKPCRVFANSMSDLFHEALPDEAIDRVFAVMELCPQHVFQILTKRPKKMRSYISSLYGNTVSHTWRHVWLGVSVEDQATADERIPPLLQTPAAIRFVSYEPALGPLDFESISQCMDDNEPTQEQLQGPLGIHYVRHGAPGIDWLIIGGESGPNARPFDIQWARDAIAQCKAAGVAPFCKQLGAHVVSRNDTGFEGDTRTSWPMDTKTLPLSSPEWQGDPVRVILKDRKGGDMAEWPADLRVREFPNDRR